MPPTTFYLEQYTRLPLPPKGDQLAGKNVIITGTTPGGLGFEAALQLAELKPKTLVLTVRDPAKNPDLADKIKAKYPDLDVRVWALELSSYASIKAFAKKAEAELNTLDLLLNNAGVNPGPAKQQSKRTEDGHDNAIQTNALAPVLLSLLLRPLLAKSSAPRIVFTTSEVHAWVPEKTLDGVGENGTVLNFFDREKEYDGMLVLQMLIRRLIPALPDIVIVSVNPGLCGTNLGRNFDMSFSLSKIPTMIWYISIMRKAEVGARNLTYASVVQDDSCEYYTCCEPGASESKFLGQGRGIKATGILWKECLAEFEKVAPGSTAGFQ